VGKPEGKRTVGRPRRRWVDNIRMDLQKVGCENMDLGVDGWIILGWISRRLDVRIWTGLGWTRIETVDGHL